MSQLPFVVSGLVSVLRRAAVAAGAFLRSSWEGPLRKYHPEDHYMRGPGPKWHEKHFLDRASPGR